jgi:hypothetical protein
MILLYKNPFQNREPFDTGTIEIQLNQPLLNQNINTIQPTEQFGKLLL